MVRIEVTESIGARRPLLMLAAAAVLCTAVLTVGCSQPTGVESATDWPMYRHDLAGTGYSPLDQITVANVGGLEQAWTFSLDDPQPPAGKGGGGKGKGKGGFGRGGNSQATPIVAEGVMYLPAGNRVVALQPETGAEIWSHTIEGAAPSRRGVAYWAGDGEAGPRIILAARNRLIALNAATGEPDPTFGEGGEVDMGIPYNSVPLIYKNVIVAGANTVQGYSPGNARAFDVRSGAKLWEFNSVPQPGEVGHDTWEGDSWMQRSGVNAWPFYFTADAERDLLYLPLASPVPGGYGGDRPGENLFGNSVVAVNALTGEYVWHFQTIHHDLWDHDPPAPPALFDVQRGGVTIPALALTTKSGYMFLLNRETGEPLYEVEERPVPASDVPTEAAWPTQPIPTKPAPIARTSFSMEDLVTADDTTPEHAQACMDLIEQSGEVINQGPYTPWVYRAKGGPPRTSVVFPGGLGGANWGGPAVDAATGYVLVVTHDAGTLAWTEQTPEGSPIPYDKVNGPGRGNFTASAGPGLNWPCQKPPWGQLIAVDPSTGDFAWQVRLGVTEELPEGKQNTGRAALAGPILTAGGVSFVAATDDNYFWAFETNSGRELWSARLPNRGNADPITYLGSDGKQYVAIVASDTLAVFALP